MSDFDEEDEFQRADRILRNTTVDYVLEGELVNERVPGVGPNVRLSAPLLKRLEAIASLQGRRRGNLIQDILWSFVRQWDHHALVADTIREVVEVWAQDPEHDIQVATFDLNGLENSAANVHSTAFDLPQRNSGISRVA